MFDTDKYQEEKTGWTRAVYMRKMNVVDAAPINMAMPTPPASPVPEADARVEDSTPPSPAEPSAAAEQHHTPPPSPLVIPVSSHTTTTSPATTPAAPTERSRGQTPETPIGSTPSSSPSPPAPAQSDEAAPPLQYMLLRSQLQRIEARQLHFQEEFKYMCIWVRIHNIPLSLMTEALARTLGSCIGKVVMTDTRLEDGNMGEFLRVCVSLDTTKPLRRCVTLSRPTAKAILCPLQYERVPIFCHGCGHIGHIVLQCPTTPQGDDQKLQYGAWLPSVPAPTATDAAASVPTSVGPATSIAPLAPSCDATVSAPLRARSSRDNVHVACDNEAPYDPMLHCDVSDAMEDSLDVLNGCTLFSVLVGMVQSAGLDDVVD
ncbi:hypothetical protein GQ457_18G000130 [Hibiscus cannabinus]